MGTPIKPVGYIYNDKAFLSDPHPDWNPIYVLIRQSDAMAVINQQQADMRQMAGDVQAIQEIHSQQKAKLYARIAELESENARLRKACSKQQDEIQRVLGVALGYGVDTGDHIAESLADEAAATIKRLRKDSERLDWLAHVDNNIGGVYLPNDCVMQNITDMREAIDMAMDMYKNQQNLDTSAERVEKSAESVHVDWPEDESRIDVVGQNGNTGEHYEVKL